MTSWETILRENGPSVWRTAYRLLGNRSDADDCLQDVFVAAVTVSRRGEVRHWPGLLQRLATQRAIDRLRRRVRERLRQDAGERLLTTADAGPAPDAAAVNGELAERLRAALGQLPARQGQIVALRYLNEMSYEDIARQLSMTVSHVGVVLSRARETLRKRLTERGADHD